MLPLVSATVFCYNHEHYVEECLDGVLAQDYPDLELIITDDCSTDRSAEVIEAWLSRHRVKADFVRHGRNLGVAATVNDGYSRARGKYLAPCSSDDVWLPGKISRHVEIMERLPETVGILYSDAYRMDEAGRPLPGMFIERCRKFEQPPAGDIFPELAEGNFIPGMTMLVRRAAQEAVGPYDPQFVYEDWDMMLRFAERYEFAYSDVPSVRYRVHSRSATSTLLASRPPAVLYTDFRLIERSVRSPRLPPEVRARLLDRLSETSYALFAADAPERIPALRGLLRHRPGLHALLMYLFSLARVPSAYASRLARARRLRLARGRRRALQQPPRHVHGDAHGRAPPEGPARGRGPARPESPADGDRRRRARPRPRRRSWQHRGRQTRRHHRC